MSEDLPGFEGLGVPGATTTEWQTDPALGAEPIVGIGDDVLHPGAKGVRRPRAMRVSVPYSTPVVLLVSSGPADRPGPSVTMPNLRNVGIEKATRKMARLGLILQASPTYALGIGANRVAAQYPEPGQRVSAGAAVSVLTSNGRKPPKGLETQLPDLVGSLAADAETAVLSAGLRPAVIRSPHPSAHPELVFAQLPNAHAVPMAGHHGVGRVLKWLLATIVWAAIVAVLVSVAMQPFAMPNVQGSDAQASTRRLRFMGLRVAPILAVPLDSSHRSGEVVGQMPAAGTMIKRGSTVRLSVARTHGVTFLPDVVGMRREEARWVIGTIATLRVVETAGQGRAKGTVLAQDPPADSEIGPSTVVTVYVSDGH